MNSVRVFELRSIYHNFVARWEASDSGVRVQYDGGPWYDSSSDLSDLENFAVEYEGESFREIPKEEL